MHRLLLTALVALLLAVTVAGCGSGADEGSAESWADDVCGSLNSWFEEVDSAVAGLTDDGLELSRDDVDAAVETVGDATTQLGDDLEQLDPLETESGSEAEEVVTGLRETLGDDVDAIEDALSGTTPPLEAVSAVATALSSAAEALKEAFDQLVELDVGGELEAAFEDAGSCDELRERLSEIGG